MDLRTNRRQAIQGAMGLALARAWMAMSVAPVLTAEAGAARGGVIKMGIQPWLGYGPWHIAAKQGLFRANGLDRVEIVNFTSDSDLNAALASGRITCGSVATHTAMAFAAAGLPIKIVALLDVSMTADAVISDGSVHSIADLEGKQVAFEEGTTSDILLNYALARNGMTITDIIKVPMSAADAGAALIAGRVRAAVTYEPYISVAKLQSDKVKVLFTAGVDPGLISDVFVVREEFLTERPGQIVALLRAWDAALRAYRADTKSGRRIVAQAVGAKPEELMSAFDGVAYYSLAENEIQLGGDFLRKIAPEVKAAARKAGLLTQDVDAGVLIVNRFVDEAVK